MKKENTSYVKIDNANMIKLSLKQLAKLYTEYAHLILQIKKMSDRKKDMRNELFAKLKDVETKYSTFIKELPEFPDVEIKKPNYPVQKDKSVIVEGLQDPFEELKNEFESLRNELENIR